MKERIKDKQPSVAIIIVNYNGAEDTIECVKSLNKINYDNYKIFVIDNGSSKKPTKEQIDYLKGVLYKCVWGAIILIVLWHLNSAFPNCLPAFGERGVEFFFLISGLLIGIKYYDSNKMKTLGQTAKYAVEKEKKVVLRAIPFGQLKANQIMMWEE